MAERSQVFPSQFDLHSQLFADSEYPLMLDSAATMPKQRLMPANLSFMEKWLWGEDGVVRGIGLEPPLSPESEEAS